MARRGLIAEIVHINRVAARERESARRAAIREYTAAVRRAEQARKADERAQALFARATLKEQKRLEKEAREAHIEAMNAEVDEHNLQLEEIYTEIDSILTATLHVDDYVDLETFRVVAEHPPFPHPELEAPIPLPDPIPIPREPTLIAPNPPKGFAKLFGRRKHMKDMAEAQMVYEQAVAAWRKEVENIPDSRQLQLKEHADAEARRVATLEGARSRYAEECATREKEARERNKQLDSLIANLAYGSAEAVQEYVSIVLANSVYTKHFPVTHDFEFEPASAELRLNVFVPRPDELPTVKAYKYVKAADEITTTPLSQKACRDRYESAVHQVALRSIHEVFEADRRGVIKTISLKVGAVANDPATGQQGFILFVVAGAGRESFIKFNLSDVVPSQTLAYLGAAVSKNPYGLMAVEALGVRRS